VPVGVGEVINADVGVDVVAGEAIVGDLGVCEVLMPI